MGLKLLMPWSDCSAWVPFPLICPCVGGLWNMLHVASTCSFQWLACAQYACSFVYLHFTWPMCGNPHIPPNSHSQAYLSSLDPAQCGSRGKQRNKIDIALKWKGHFRVRGRFLFVCFECGFLYGFCFGGCGECLCNWNGKVNTGMYHFSCSSRRGLLLPLVWELKPNCCFWNGTG